MVDQITVSGDTNTQINLSFAARDDSNQVEYNNNQNDVGQVVVTDSSISVLSNGNVVPEFSNNNHEIDNMDREEIISSTVMIKNSVTTMDAVLGKIYRE